MKRILTARHKNAALEAPPPLSDIYDVQIFVFEGP